LLVAFTVATVASAVLPSFGLVLVARFIAGLPHGAYFGIATLVAASFLEPGKRGRGVALVLSGLTIANVVGVPSITLLGQVAGWRVAYLAVAAIFALTFVAVALAVPHQAGDKSATFARELAAFARPQVWITLLVGAIGFGGFFAVYSYVAPVVTEVTGQTAASSLSPAIQSRLMDVAGDSQTLAAAANHAALNIGNSLGAFLGGATIPAGFGYLSPALVGLVLCVPGIALALASVSLQRRGSVTA
jgi:DHA1 family inner membrane transport protein